MMAVVTGQSAVRSYILPTSLGYRDDQIDIAALSTLELPTGRQRGEILITRASE